MRATVTVRPRPGTAAGRPLPTLAERIDRELRGHMLRLVADLPRRPSEGWDDLARCRTRPAGKSPDRLAEAAGMGVSPDAVEQCFTAMGRAVAALLRQADRAA